ncbi:hypothetical protein TNCV_2991871 [Trichonephila clavipes]|nr:hypothetical protein TNCV_2991871 [Trichonephila clavipes]
MEKNKSSVHPTNSPLFSDANEGSHLPINIDPESKPQRAQPLRCSHVPNGGRGRGGIGSWLAFHELLKPCSMQYLSENVVGGASSGVVQTMVQNYVTCSSVSDVGAGVEPRLKTLELPDVLTSDGELQQPGPRRSRYGRLLKPRKGLNEYF